MNGFIFGVLTGFLAFSDKGREIQDKLREVVKKNDGDVQESGESPAKRSDVSS